ncbi:hypothetical protein [Mycoplasma capricolum]|uniref:Uncharacterized protein n=1 Tax=Mycoplasma capricolum subsp. capricolum (strain California kid / ATCC 27343 / NCTC 10154) TaxID=340047 RepID=Q2SS46_MYCCT|nr:hypothetical protein MCAP_0443 [Mycoplasma capricolum subsp. capricolum ATCC 27343]
MLEEPSDVGLTLGFVVTAFSSFSFYSDFDFVLLHATAKVLLFVIKKNEPNKVNTFFTIFNYNFNILRNLPNIFNKKYRIILYAIVQTFFF